MLTKAFHQIEGFLPAGRSLHLVTIALEESFQDKPDVFLVVDY